MKRSTISRNNGLQSGPKIALIMGTALASVALTGCSTSSAPRADASFSKAQVALEKGQVTKAISHAEAAVLAEPRNAQFRSVLGAAYLEAGRFGSAATSFDDAMQLGDNDARTVLSYSLAKIATGDSRGALAKLEANETAINPADYGLAIALAGKAERGTHVLMNALRAGQNTAKVRQNLAYAYALAGNWRAARVMAAEDVPADQLDARLSGWASTAQPGAFATRVADLLQVTPSRDGGQPQMLALANYPSVDEMVAQAVADTPAQTASVEAATAPPVVAAVAPTKPVAAKTAAFKPKPAPAAVETIDPSIAKILAATGQKTPTSMPNTGSSGFVSNPVVQKLPAASAAPKRVAKAPVAAPTRAPKPATQRRMASAAPTAETHLVQLGSFSSRAEAERGWSTIKAKFPQLKSHDVVITQAEVKGKTYFRVAAAGFGQSTARTMCRTVKASGRGCFSYAAANPPKGAVDRGVRIAARTR